MNIDPAVIPIASIIISAIGALAAIIFGIVSLRKTLHETPFFFNHRAREEHRFAREFLKELKASPDMHPYARATGLRAISGNPDDDPEMIEYLISLVQPPNAMRAFKIGRQFVAYETTGKAMRFKPAYANKLKWMRIRRAVAFFCFYGGCALPLFAPSLLALLKKPVWRTLDMMLPAIAFYEPIMMLGLILSIRATVRLREATLLVRDQKPFEVRPAQVQLRRLAYSSRAASPSRR